MQQLLDFFSLLSYDLKRKYLHISLLYLLPLSFLALGYWCTDNYYRYMRFTYTKKSMPLLLPMLHLFQKYIGNQSMGSALCAVENIGLFFKMSCFAYFVESLHKGIKEILSCMDHTTPNVFSNQVKYYAKLLSDTCALSEICVS